MIWRELSQEIRNRVSCANTILRGPLFVNMCSVGEDVGKVTLNNSSICYCVANVILLG